MRDWFKRFRTATGACTLEVNDQAQTVKRSKTSSARMTFRAPFLRKEVIQPHFPVRLPCYDFTPLTRHTFDVAFH